MNPAHIAERYLRSESDRDQQIGRLAVLQHAMSVERMSIVPGVEHAMYLYRMARVSAACIRHVAYGALMGQPVVDALTNEAQEVRVAALVARVETE
jgi:hypothetical protein